MWSGRWPGNEAICMLVIYSESEEAAASSASMLGMPMLLTNFGVRYSDIDTVAIKKLYLFSQQLNRNLHHTTLLLELHTALVRHS